MLCQECGEREATFHFKESIDGETREFWLCEICAQKKGLLEDFFEFSLPGLLAGLGEIEVEEEKRCPGCGHLFQEIKEKGKFGCSKCYETFKGKVVPLLEKIHGKTLHRGKVPGGRKKVEEKREIQKLREELEEAVAREEYEKAAKLRDRIKELEEKIKKDET